MILGYPRTILPLMISGGKRSFLFYFFQTGCLLLLLFSCQGRRPAYITLDGKAQGTTFHIVYADIHHRDFTTSVDSLLRLIDKSMSLWDSTSVICRINRNDPDVVPDEHFLKVLDKSREIAASTHGAFDVTIGPLVKAWGLSVKHDLPMPDSAMVDSLLQLTGYEKIKYESGQLMKSDPRIQLDFNAIAQGYTVDLLVSFLASKGIENCLVEIGGEVRAMGVNPQNTAWQIGIDQPTDSLTTERMLQTTVGLNDKALATSGHYRKYIKTADGKRSHIIDPKSGYPTRDSLLSVSVLADDAMTADAYATAFLVIGLTDAMEKAKGLDLEMYCIYQAKDGPLKTMATPGFFR